MTEGMRPIPEEEIRQLNRDLMEKVLDRACSDPTWKQQLLDEPEVALQEAGFPELTRLEAMRESAAASGEAEVVGHRGGTWTTSGVLCCGLVGGSTIEPIKY